MRPAKPFHGGALPQPDGFTAAILAGGLGTRLRTTLPGLPKVLAEAGGRPFIFHLIERAASAGARRIVLCTGFMGDEVRAAVGDSAGETSIAYSREESPLGTAGALRLALPLFDSDTVLVMNGDSIFDTDLARFRRRHRAKKAEASILLARVSDTSRFGTVLTDEEERVAGFEEKTGLPGAGWINAGIYLISKRLISGIPSGRAVSLERETFPLWIGAGLFGFRSKGRFLDIGTPESYSRREQFFASLRAGNRK